MSTIPGPHLWAAAILAPVGFLAGFGAAWAAAAAITLKLTRNGYPNARRRHD